MSYVKQILFLILTGISCTLTCAAQDGQPTNETESLFYDAIRNRINGNDAEAQRLLEAYVQKRPEISAAWYDLARLAMKTQRLEEARNYILKAIGINKDNKWYQEEYGNIMALQ